MKRLLTLCLDLLVLLVVSAALLFHEEKAFAQAREVRDWKIVYFSDKAGGSGEVNSRDSYNLQNITHPETQILMYGSRKYGINLVWGAPYIEDGNIRFEPQQGSGSIKQGQVVAIHVSNGGYLYYKERKYGINLEFSPTPRYEWELRPSEPIEPRDPVRERVKVGLYNRTHREYVVYCEREYGINLRWAKDCK